MSVTENDIDEENGLKPTILEITSKNNGLFKISGDRKDIFFTPVSGFSGVANITYLVCNSTNEVCAQTTASIIVPNPRDTFEVNAIGTLNVLNASQQIKDLRAQLIITCLLYTSPSPRD